MRCPLLAVDLLSCTRCDIPIKTPRFISTFIAFGIAMGVLFMVGVIVGESITQFTANAVRASRDAQLAACSWRSQLLLRDLRLRERTE